MRRAWQGSGRTRLAAGLVLIAVIAGLVVTSIAGGGGRIQVSSAFVAGTPEGGAPVRLDTSLYMPVSAPAPAVLLSQGFGGDKHDLDSTARSFARHGFVVLAYTARGFGASGGLIHFDAPDYEVRDGELLLDYLARLPQVARSNGRPELAVAGASYGGALSLLIAAADHRVGAVAADITWNDLGQALFPNFGGEGPGVFKRLWAGGLFADAFSAGPGGSGSSVACGRFAPVVCAAYQDSAAAGTPSPTMQALMAQASPAGVLDRISAPTLLTQGEQDSLFPLSEADANARGIAARGTPVRVMWRSGGHDTGGGTGTATSAAIAWFHHVFAGGVGTSQPFQLVEQAGVISAATGDVSQQTLQATRYPGVAGAPQRSTGVAVSGPAQAIGSPAGGVPAVITSVPGLGDALGLLSSAGSAGGGLPTVPGQTATFTSPALKRSTLIAGSPTVTMQVSTHSTTDAVLFAALRDVAPDGTATLPAQLVAPIRLTGLTPGTPRTITIALPSVVRTIAAGHRLVLTVSASDFAYAGPADAREYTIGLPAGHSTLSLPTLAATTIAGGAPIRWLIIGAVVFVLALGGVAVVLVRRRRVLRPDPDLADTPVSIASLVKEYSGGYRAVDDVSFQVERGQVVGLLGPNGAGKTTMLRVLVGLITPTSGSVYVFGEPVVPGAPVLARLGAFIEGPGFLPHLSGRDNLRLYWAATGRPADEADFDTALDIAGLGASIDRRVRTYSHGMKQRLGIAQAMLSLPELLVLDEPTNGLDPPQIAEMREVLQRYAETGRTVVISSHLLAEVEQTCTHVVVMHRGRVVAAGPTLDIAGAGGMQVAVADPGRATRVLAAAGIHADLVPTSRALEDVFLTLVGDRHD